MAVEDAPDRVVEPVADDRERNARSFDLGDERRERAVDHHAVQVRVDLLAARVEQRDLLGHAVVRADLAAAPGLLDGLPARAREALEQRVGDVLDGNGAVEIAENGPVGHALSL